MNWVLARLIAVQICIHACMSGARMASPLLALQDGRSAAAVGILLSLYALAQCIFSLPAGHYADRHGLRRPVALCVGFTVFGIGLAAIWPVFPVLCVAAFLSGGATGSAVIALQRHVSRMVTDKVQLKQVFSWMAIAPSISNFAGPFVAGLLIDHAGFRTAFTVMAILPLASWFWVRKTAELPAQERLPANGKQSPWDLLNNPLMRRLLIVNWLLSSCWDVHTFVLPILGHERGLSASVIGTILGVFALAATAIRLVIPVLAARLQEWAVISGSMVATAILFFIYPMLQTALAMGLCSIMLGFSLGSVQPMMLSSMHQITPPHRHGEALGLRMLSINTSSSILPLLFGTVGAAIGVSSVFWAVGAMVACGIPAARKLKPKE